MNIVRIICVRCTFQCNLEKRRIVESGLKTLITHLLTRVPTAQGKWSKKNPCQGKHREFGNFVKTQGKHREFCLNIRKTQGILSRHRKTQGILLAQVVNVLILKVKDIAVVAAKKNHFFPEVG